MRHTPCGCAPYGEGAVKVRRARQPRRAVSAAADGRGKQVCTQTVVPARDHRVAALLAIDTRERTMINETAPVGRGHVLLYQRLCLRGESPLVSRLDSASPSCSLSPPQGCSQASPRRQRKRQTVQANIFVRSRQFLHRRGHVPALQRCARK